MQLHYSIEHAAAVAGSLYDTDLAHRIIAMRNNQATDLPYGLAVVSDVGGSNGTDKAARQPGAIGDTLMGVSVYSQAHAPGPIDSFGVNGIRPNDMFNMLTRGGANVPCEQAVQPTDPVFYRFGPSATNGGAVSPAAGGADQTFGGGTDVLGAFRRDADIVPAWSRKTLYTAVGQRFAYDGHVYAVTVIGTSEDNATPTWADSTGSAIVDGNAVIMHVGLCDASTRASAVQVSSGARWMSKTTAAGVAVLELNLP